MPQATLTGFDLDTAYTIRTPRRPARRSGAYPRGYAAQLWGQLGHWEVGTYPMPWQAKNAARRFAITEPLEPTAGEEVPPNWHWHRSGSHAPDDCYKFGTARGRAWVRRVKGNAWQSRPWVSGFGNLNLGLFTTADFGAAAQNRAVRISKAFDAEWQGRVTVAQAVAQLKRRPANSWERVADHIAVPECARKLLRPPPRIPAAVERANDLAARFPRDLWGARVTAADLLDSWAEREKQREDYAAEFQEALAEGEPFAECVAILSP